jgi:hypothetical protein
MEAYRLNSISELHNRGGFEPLRALSKEDEMTQTYYPTEQQRLAHDELLHRLVEEILNNRASIDYVFYTAMSEHHNLRPSAFAYAKPHTLYQHKSYNRLDAALTSLENLGVHLPSADWQPGRQVWCDGLEEREYSCWLLPVASEQSPGWAMGTMCCGCQDFRDHESNRGIPITHFCKHLVSYWLLTWAFYRLYDPNI